MLQQVKLKVGRGLSTAFQCEDVRNEICTFQRWSCLEWFIYLLCIITFSELWLKYVINVCWHGEKKQQQHESMKGKKHLSRAAWLWVSSCDFHVGYMDQVIPDSDWLILPDPCKADSWREAILDQEHQIKTQWMMKWPKCTFNFLKKSWKINF